MSWTTPRTWVDSTDHATAALLNVHLRDNSNFLASPPSCFVYHSVAQSVSNNSIQALVFDSERRDNDTMHSVSSSTSRITINTAGAYSLYFSGAWDSQATYAGVREFMFRINGNNSQLVAVDDRYHGSAANGQTLYHSIAGAWQFVASDYVEVCGFQTSSGGLSVLATGNGASPEFRVCWEGF